MGLRGENPQPSVLWNTAPNRIWMRAMRSKINKALIVSASAIALVLATGETFAASRSARGAFASAHRPGGHFSHHDRRSRAAIGWFGDDGVYYGPNGEELAPPTSGSARTSDTN